MPDPTSVTREMVIKKAGLLFPQEDISQIISILDGYGHEAHHREADRVKMAALRLSNGKMERLQAFVETACNDYRDVLTIAEYPCQYRANMTNDTTVPLPEDPETFDSEQYQAWLDAEIDIARFYICVKCCGVGILPIFPETPGEDLSSHLPQWFCCPDCQGTGQPALRP